MRRPNNQEVDMAEEKSEEETQRQQDLDDVMAMLETSPAEVVLFGAITYERNIRVKHAGTDEDPMSKWNRTRFPHMVQIQFCTLIARAHDELLVLVQAKKFKEAGLRVKKLTMELKQITTAAGLNETPIEQDSAGQFYSTLSMTLSFL